MTARDSTAATRVLPPAGARTPEELETLLEDAFVLRDPVALAQLVEEQAVLVEEDGGAEAQGRAEVARAMAGLWAGHDGYVADAPRVVQLRDTALVLNRRAIHVVCRDETRSWRYSISIVRPRRPT